MAPTSTAIFRAVADFASLNREVGKTRREIARLQAQAGQTGGWDKFDAALGRVTESQESLRKESAALGTSQDKLGKTLAVQSGRLDKYTTSLNKTSAAQAKLRKETEGLAKSQKSLGGGVSGLTSLEKALRSLATAQDRVRTSAGSLNSSITNQRNTLTQAQSHIKDTAKATRELATAEERATKSAQNHAKSLGDERDAARTKVTALSALSGALRQVSQAEVAATTASRMHTSHLQRETAASAATTNQHRTLAASTRDAGRSASIAGADHDIFRESLDRVRATSSGASSGLNQYGSALRNVGSSSNTAASGQRSISSAMGQVGSASRTAASQQSAYASSVRQSSSASQAASSSGRSFANSMGQVGSSSRGASSGAMVLGAALNPLRSGMRGAGEAGQGLRTILAVLIPTTAVAGIQLLIQSLSALVAGLVSVVGAAGPAAGALAALGPAAAAAAGGIATAMLSFRGVGTALKAMIGLDKQAGASGASMGNQRAAAAKAVGSAQRSLRDAIQAQQDAERQGARSVADALRSLERARRDAAQAAEDAARRISDAERDVSRARRDAAYAAEDAARRVQDAQRALIRANQSVVAAEKELHEARRQAIRDLDDLQERVSDNALSQESAEIRLLRAQERQREVNENGLSSELDRREAALAVAEAQDALSDTTRQAGRDQEDYNKAQQGGIDGMPAVVSAQQALSSALEAQQEAARGVADAQRDAARQQQESAERIADAERNLQDAKRDAARQQVQSAERIADAERSLAEAREDAARRARDAAERVADAQLALAEAQKSANESMAGGSAAANALAQAMAKLSPKGRELVELLHSLIPQIDKMSKAGQEAFFPGLIEAIKILVPMIDTVAIPVIESLGRVLGQVAVAGATEIRSWGDDIRNFGQGAGADILSKMGTILINLASAMQDVSMAAVPLTQWLFDLGARLSAYWKTEAEAARGDGRLDAYFDRVRATLELLGSIIFNVGGILKEVFGAAAPSGERLLKSFDDLTARTRKWMGTTEGRNSLKEYFDAAEPNVRLILDLLGKVALAFIKAGASPALTKMLESIRDTLGPSVERFFGELSEAVATVGPKLVELFAGVLDFFSTLMEAGTGGGFAAFIDVISGFVDVLNAIVSIPFAATIIGWVTALAGAAVAFKAIHKLLTGVAKAIPGVSALNSVLGGAGRGGRGAATAGAGFRAGLSGSAVPAATGTGRAGQAAGGALRNGAGTVGGFFGGRGAGAAPQPAPAPAGPRALPPGGAAPRALPSGPNRPALPPGGLGPIAPPYRPQTAPNPPGTLARGGPRYPAASGAPIPSRGPIPMGPGRDLGGGASVRPTPRAQIGGGAPDPAKINEATQATQKLGAAQKEASKSAEAMGAASKQAAQGASQVGAASQGAAREVRAVGTASSAAAGQVTAVGESSKRAATTSTRSFSGVGSKIGGAFSSVSNTATRALSGVTGAASKSASGVSGAFSSVSSKIGAAMAPTAGRVSSALAPTATAATSAATKVGGAFSSVPGRVGSALTPVASRVTSAFAPAATAATSAATKVGGAFTGVADRVGTALAPVGQRITGAFAPGVAGATAAAGQVGASTDRMAADTERSTSRVGNAFRSMGSAIGNAATSAADRFRGVGSAADEAGRAAENAGRTAAGSAAGFGTAGTAAQGASGKFGALRSAAGGLSAFLGGPWGVAMAGAAIAIGVIASAYAEMGRSASENAQKAIDGSLTLAEAIRAETQATDERTGFYLSDAHAQTQRAAAQKRVTDEYWATYNALSPLKQAETDAAQAAHVHSEAVKEFGPASAEARGAADQWAIATDKVELEQKAAADATKSHTERVQEQRDLLFGSLDADLAKQQSLLRVKDQQDQLNKAVADHGPKSREAEEANLTLQTSMLGYIQKAGDAAVKQAELNGVQDTAKARTDAQNAAALELAATHSGPLPEALQRVIAGMDESALSAAGATIKTDEFGNRVATLNGKTVILDANRQPGDTVIDGFEQRQIPPKVGDVDANTDPADRTIRNWLSQAWGVVVDLFGPADGKGAFAGGGLVGFAGGGLADQGGVLGGFSPGRDTVPAMLSPGEAVLVPELVKKIGAKNILRANKEASGRSATILGNPQGFAAGGMVERRRPEAANAGAAPATAPAPVDPAMVSASADSVRALASQMSALTPELLAAQAAGSALLTTSLQPLAAQLGTNLVASLTTLRQTGLLPFRNDLTLTQLGTQASTLAMTTAMNTHRDLSNAALLGIRTLGLNPLRTDLTATQQHELTATTAMTDSMNVHRDLSNAAMLGIRDLGLTPLRDDMLVTQDHTKVQTDLMGASTELFRDRSNASMDATRQGLVATDQAVDHTANWFRDRMATMQKSAADPVRAVISGPFNSGIIAAWNTLDKQFGLGKSVGNVPIGFASGGPLTGGQANKDSIPIMGMPGEYMLSKKAVEQLGGQGVVDQWHRKLRAGLRPEGVGMAVGGPVVPPPVQPVDPTPAVNAAFANTYGMIGGFSGNPHSASMGGVARVGADGVKAKALEAAWAAARAKAAADTAAAAARARAAAPAPVPMAAGGPVEPNWTYQVKPGDSLTWIANAYGSSVEDLQRINGLTNPNSVFAGDWVTVPPPPGPQPGPDPDPEPEQPTGPRYKVKKGDTLSSVAKWFGTSSSTLKKLNDLVSSKINIGQLLSVPTHFLEAAKAVLERTKSGGKVGEDWEWKGAPDVVKRHGDRLEDLYDDPAGRKLGRTKWLEQYLAAVGYGGSAAAKSAPTTMAAFARTMAASDEPGGSGGGGTGGGPVGGGSGGDTGGGTGGGSTGGTSKDAELLEAAKAVLDRVRQGGSLDKEWRWKGAPDVVKKWGDELEDLYDDPEGRKLGRTKWLEQYVAKGGSTGGDAGGGDGGGGDTGGGDTGGGGTSTGASLEQWAAAMQKNTADTKEFESNLLTLTRWGYDDLALALSQLGMDSVGTDNAGGLDLSRQAVKSPAEAARIEKIVEDSKTVIGPNLENALKIMGALSTKSGLGIREVSTEAKLDTKNIFDTLSASPGVLQQIATLPAANRDKFMSNWEAYKNGLPFAYGGRVPGTGRGDTVPAMLTPGEFVIRKDAAKAIGAQGLNRMNKADTLPTQVFASGGEVLRAEDLFSLVSSPQVSRPSLGRGVQERLSRAMAGSGDTTNSKSVVFGEGSVQIHNPAPARATDSFEGVMRKLSWSGTFS